MRLATIPSFSSVCLVSAKGEKRKISLQERERGEKRPVSVPRWYVLSLSLGTSEWTPDRGNDMEALERRKETDEEKRAPA